MSLIGFLAKASFHVVGSVIPRLITCLVASHVMRIRAHIRWLSVSAVLLAAGCGVSSTNELSGDYAVRYTHGLEKLTLKTNGTFTQLYTPAGSTLSATNSGTWEFRKADGRILLRDAVEFEEKREAQSLEKVVWLIRIEKRFGKVSLIINEDDGLDYDKSK